MAPTLLISAAWASLHDRFDEQVLFTKFKTRIDSVGRRFTTYSLLDSLGRQTHVVHQLTVLSTLSFEQAGSPAYDMLLPGKRSIAFAVIMEEEVRLPTCTLRFASGVRLPLQKGLSIKLLANTRNTYCNSHTTADVRVHAQQGDRTRVDAAPRLQEQRDRHCRDKAASS
jgi:hypothetical protein